MRVASLTLLVLVVGCASPSPPKKPSPYHYIQTLDIYRKELL